MGLSIRTTPAQLEINTYPAGLKYNIKEAELSIRQKQPLIEIKTEMPVVLIDQYQCFAEAGLKNNADIMKEQAQKGYNCVLKFIAKKAQDGDAMKRIGHKANIMIDIAKRSAIKKYDFNVGFIPKSRPEFDLKGGTVDLEAEFRNNLGEINGVTCGYKPGDVQFNYIPGKVDIRMKSYGSINITYTGENVDQYI